MDMMINLNAATFTAAALPHGSMRESAKWVRKFRSGGNRGRVQATRFFRLHKPDEMTIKAIIDFVEAARSERINGFTSF